MSLKPLRPEIWVPGEQNEYGITIMDVRADVEITLPEKGADMKVPTRSGDLKARKGVKGELVRVEEGRGDKRIAIVRFKGMKDTVAVLVLGDWQLAGEKAPPAEVGGA